MKVLIIGSGMSGATAARLLADVGHSVMVLETREHAGGNCHDERLENGVRLHQYGPHLFHTSDEKVWNFLSRFTAWTEYRHRVVADTRLGRISIPYNLRTEQQVGRRLTDGEIRELIFVEYSAKQWGVPWEEMPAAITGRVPTRRENDDDGYFTDRFQGQPKEGYAALFSRMLEGIPIRLGMEKNAWRAEATESDLVIYTGKVDEYFGYCYGRLPYRSLRFEHTRTKERLPYAVINQCNALPWTRIYDHQWFSGENGNAGMLDTKAGTGHIAEDGSLPETIVTKEYPLAHDDTNDPYYPMPFGEGMALYQRYKALADQEPHTVFLGRLATYSYLDMWMAVAQAMVKLRA
jgi:UDP-galactopyranose mutase